MKDEGKSRVKRRRVFYIPGFDPIHPRRYRELYRSEGAAQAALSGYALTLSARRGMGFGWHVEAEFDGSRVSTDVEVLVWSDIVRDRIGSGILASYAQLFRTAWIYLSSGALWRLAGLRKGPIIAALYPVGLLILQLVSAILIAGFAAALAAEMTMALPVGAAWAGPLTGSLIFAVVGFSVLHLCRRADRKLYAHYLMQDFGFSAERRGAYSPELERRLGEFLERIAEALSDDLDEVLVIGHSSGAHLGVSALAGLLRDGRVPADGPALSFLSLGQVIPMVSFLPEAKGLRRDLRLLSRQDRVTWVDITAPGDGCTFALCDPVSVSGVGSHDQRWPLVISAAFSQTLRPETWGALRWRFFRLHFQYLCAFDALPGCHDDYDYFRVSAGPLTLGARFALRRPSASRIARSASSHRSMAA